MNDPKPTKHWDALAEELGATPPSEPAAQDPSTPSAPPSDVDQPDLAGDASTPGASRPKRERPPRQTPKPSPRHWSALAGDLGLEVPPEPTPAADADDTVAASGTESGSAGGPDTPGTEPLAPSQPDAWDGTPDVEEMSDPSQFARRSASLDVGFGIIATEDTRDPSFIEEAEDAVNDEDEEDEDDIDEADEDDADDSRPADDLTSSISLYTESTPAARGPDADTDRDADSFDDRDETPASELDADAISEGEEAAPDSEEKGRRRRRRRGGRRRRRPDDATRETGEGGPESGASSQSDDAEQQAEDTTEPSDAAAADDRPARGRSRRGRRRRSGKTPAGARPESADEKDDGPAGSSEEDDVFDELDSADAAEVDDEPSSGPARDRKEGDEPDDESGDDLQGGRPSHRKIPSWQEAIELIVSGNMESRSRTGDDRPRGRGRGKGRRPNRGKKS